MSASATQGGYKEKNMHHETFHIFLKIVSPFLSGVSALSNSFYIIRYDVDDDDDDDDDDHISSNNKTTICSV